MEKWRLKNNIRAFAAVLALLLLTACGGKSTVMIDYADEAAFETALNNGENLEGKVVTFTAQELMPDSALGFNVWAGEHLNFVSKKNPDIAVGDRVTVKATTIENVAGSWVIHYEKVENAVTGETTISSPEESETAADVEDEEETQDLAEIQDEEEIQEKEASGVLLVGEQGSAITMYDDVKRKDRMGSKQNRFRIPRI